MLCIVLKSGCISLLVVVRIHLYSKCVCNSRTRYPQSALYLLLLFVVHSDELLHTKHTCTVRHWSGNTHSKPYLWLTHKVIRDVNSCKASTSMVVISSSCSRLFPPLQNVDRGKNISMQSKGLACSPSCRVNHLVPREKINFLPHGSVILEKCPCIESPRLRGTQLQAHLLRRENSRHDNR